YRERFPALDIKTSMIEISKNRFSCAGGTSSLDLMLHFIREDHGDELVSLIAQNFFHDTIRDGTREQHLIKAFRIAATNPAVSQAILLMENHLEHPLSIEAIAGDISISRRQLDRLFHDNMGCSPKEYYGRLRLARAAALLHQTSLSVGEISLACGFQSASHLSRNFSGQFGETPGSYRRRRNARQEAGIRGF
ncbi:MAG: helix-turn-helix domain-containing protein, partial [Pseudomonadota bacterium]